MRIQLCYGRQQSEQSSLEWIEISFCVENDGEAICSLIHHTRTHTHGLASILHAAWQRIFERGSNSVAIGGVTPLKWNTTHQLRHRIHQMPCSSCLRAQQHRLSSSLALFGWVVVFASSGEISTDPRQKQARICQKWRQNVSYVPWCFKNDSRLRAKCRRPNSNGEHRAQDKRNVVYLLPRFNLKQTILIVNNLNRLELSFRILIRFFSILCSQNGQLWLSYTDELVRIE